MREVGAFEAKTHLSALLDAVARGETILITKRGRPAARLVPPDVADPRRAAHAAKNLSRLRERIGWTTTGDILRMRDEERR